VAVGQLVESDTGAGPVLECRSYEKWCGDSKATRATGSFDTGLSFSRRSLLESLRGSKVFRADTRFPRPHLKRGAVLGYYQPRKGFTAHKPQTFTAIEMNLRNWVDSPHIQLHRQIVPIKQNSEVLHGRRIEG
jgi:hypothetical protein